MKGLFNIFSKAIGSSKVPAPIVLILMLAGLLVIGGFIIYILWQKRKYGKIVHERNVLEERKKQAAAKTEIAAAGEEKDKLIAELVILDDEIAKKDDRIKILEETHKATIEEIKGALSWEDIVVK